MKGFHNMSYIMHCFKMAVWKMKRIQQVMNRIASYIFQNEKCIKCIKKMIKNTYISTCQNHIIDMYIFT